MRLVKTVLNMIGAGVLMLIAVVLIGLPNASDDADGALQAGQSPTPQVAPTETFPPYTPLASLTPSSTLRPPPTFEPPTNTPVPSSTPSTTPTPTAVTNVDIPGIHGLETPTPSTTPGCKVRSEWKLTYEVQPGDALDNIAQRYGTNRWELAEANCLTDANVIVVGQKLRVPGDAQPAETYDCSWELLTPIDYAYNIDGYDSITFNWHGPRAARNLIRVIAPDGQIWERVVDLRQNETVKLTGIEELQPNGLYTWYVYPLDLNFVQISCKEGGPWHFDKSEGPTMTPTPTITNTPTLTPSPTP